jgi:toxin HigB-1
VTSGTGAALGWLVWSIWLRRSKGIWNLRFAVWPAGFRPWAGIDRCHVPRYTPDVIKTFADKRTKELYESGKAKRFPPGMWERALRRLEYLDLATSVTDLKVPPSNRLHKLERDRAGQYSISVNDQWRVCFRFEDGDAYDVEITDYH